MRTITPQRIDPTAVEALTQLHQLGQASIALVLRQVVRTSGIQPFARIAVLPETTPGNSSRLPYSLPVAPIETQDLGSATREPDADVLRSAGRLLARVIGNRLVDNEQEPPRVGNILRVFGLLPSDQDLIFGARDGESASVPPAILIDIAPGDSPLAQDLEWLPQEHAIGFILGQPRGADPGTTDRPGPNYATIVHGAITQQLPQVR